MTEDGDWVEELLRGDRATPVPDDGFTARLVSRLPSRRSVLQAWIAPLMTAFGGILAIFASGGWNGTVSEIRLIYVGGVIPLLALLPIVIVFAGCAWALSESK